MEFYLPLNYLFGNFLSNFATDCHFVLVGESFSSSACSVRLCHMQKRKMGCRNTGAWGNPPPPDFGRSGNPIKFRGADYAHHITTFPPRSEFQTFLRSWEGGKLGQNTKW